MRHPLDPGRQTNPFDVSFCRRSLFLRGYARIIDATDHLFSSTDGLVAVLVNEIRVATPHSFSGCSKNRSGTHEIEFFEQVFYFKILLRSSHSKLMMSTKSSF